MISSRLMIHLSMGRECDWSIGIRADGYAIYLDFIFCGLKRASYGEQLHRVSPGLRVKNEADSVCHQPRFSGI